jgi:hypothetical protein
MRKEEEIRIIAYALWVRDGYNHTSAIKHWLEAEAIWEQNHKDINASVPSDMDFNEGEKTISKVGIG